MFGLGQSRILTVASPMRRLSRRLVAIGLLLLLGAAIVGRRYPGAPDEIAQPNRRNANRPRLVDTQPLLTAQQLDKDASTREEGRYSRDALNLADRKSVV